MRAFLGRRDRDGRASRRVQQAREWVDGHSSTKMVYWKDLKVAEEDRRQQAATAMQAAYRGWEGRQIAADRRARVEAATCIQRHLRGVLGRRRATEERWRRLQVVPTPYALKLLARRSREVEEKGGWVEYFDPDTSAFWYLEKSTKRSTWNPPDGFFRDSMTCVWDPWPVPYSSPLDKPCRRVFTNMAEFQAHRLNAHPWQCASCQQRNSGVTFPRCELCDSKVGPDGEDLEKTVGEAVRAALRGMKRNPRLEGARGAGRDSADSGSSSEYDSDEEADGNDEQTANQIGRQQKQGAGGYRDDGDDAAGACGKGPSRRRPAPRGGAHETAQDVLPERGKRKAGGPPSRRDVSDGILRGGRRGPGDGGALMRSTGEEGILDARGDASIASTVLTASEATVASSAPGMRLRVCHQFSQGKCTLSTCPRAHPGIRDDAKLHRLETKGSRGLFEVVVCPLALAAALEGREGRRGEGEPRDCGGGCPSGKECKLYHPYVRPPTGEIVSRIYPRRNGERTKTYPSGATLKGTVVDEVYQGYGVYSWPNGDVYLGQWVDGVRHGGGIFRSADGREYVGSWAKNVREGHGVLTHPNGDRYEGEFHCGKIHGVGFLSGAGGDSFRGEFKDGRPQGIGCFRRKNGDKYNGHIRSGEAHGLGVLAYAAGEKYKGDFRADVRCGRGVCCYPNGAKFAGQWERNTQEGFGVYVSPGGRERYVGQWRSGKKHGYGRYIFANGDIYDGDFQRDQAWGQGIYRTAASGNGAGDCYVGGWEEDLRHGKGTLRWENGSRYEGYWKAGSIEGKGVFDYARGDQYRGEFKASRKHGKGVYVWTNGDRYTGEFCWGVIAGFGEITYEVGGHRYRGYWKENRKHGLGTFWYVDGNVYHGEFFEDDVHGRGRLTICPGSILEEVYDGDFVRGVKHGRGLYVYRKGDGMVYDGEWDDGLRHGQGLLRFIDGSFYKGQFLRERKHGTGSMVWADGSQYHGKWALNLRHGEGTLLHADGSIFRGRFHRDKKTGAGTITSLDGSCYEGEWENDQVLGTKGRFTLLTGPAHEDKVHLRVFGY